MNMYKKGRRTMSTHNNKITEKLSPRAALVSIRTSSFTEQAVDEVEGPRARGAFSTVIALSAVPLGAPHCFRYPGESTRSGAPRFADIVGR